VLRACIQGPLIGKQGVGILMLQHGRGNGLDVRLVSAKGRWRVFLFLFLDVLHTQIHIHDNNNKTHGFRCIVRSEDAFSLHVHAYAVYVVE
jgi:hypothetical protein